MNRTMRTVKGLLLGVLSMGFSTVIAACYGVPDEDYYSPSPGPSSDPLVRGHVTDETSGVAIKGIRVACDGAESCLTDEQGFYEVKTLSRPAESSEVFCAFQDSDMNADGTYAAEEASFMYTDGTVAELDVALSPVPPATP